MSSDTTAQSEVIIACNPNPIPAEQRERWLEVATQMYAAVQEVQELPDGYAFRLPSDPEMLPIVAEDLNYDRLCCPFIRYTLDIEPNAGPYWLRFTGGEGVKEFLRMSFESSNLLNEQVAQAAGFSIAARTEINSVEAALETVSVVNEQFARPRVYAPKLKTEGWTLRVLHSMGSAARFLPKAATIVAECHCCLLHAAPVFKRNSTIFEAYTATIKTSL